MIKNTQRRKAQKMTSFKNWIGKRMKGGKLERKKKKRKLEERNKQQIIIITITINDNK